MKSSFEYVFTSNLLVGNYEKEKYSSLKSEDKETLLNSLSLSLAKKAYLNKMFSLILGIIVALSAIIFTILMIVGTIYIGEDQWFFYIFFLLGFVLIWLILYYLCGFIFYSRLSIKVHFKNTKSNKCMGYVESNYAKWVNKYQGYLGVTNFTYNKEMVYFGLKMPSIKNGIIFNEVIYCNIPYYYLTIKKKKIIFLPYMTLVIDGKNSKVYENQFISFKSNDNNIKLTYKDEIIGEFTCNGEFNNNFFYLKFNQD